MPYPSRVETSSPVLWTERLELASLIAKLEHSVELLAEDIAQEEKRVGIRDAGDPAYSSLARSLGARKANLSATINTLLSATKRGEADQLV